jgi:dolichol kinase
MNTEIKRKVLHLILTSYPLWYISSSNFLELHITTTLALLVTWCLSEILRTHYKFRLSPTYILLKHMTRKRVDALSIGFKTPNWLIGYLIPSVIFSPTDVINGVCVLCFGDAAASLFGKKGERKSFQGSLIGFLVSLSFCFMFTSDLRRALGASFWGMLVEHLSQGINDNYTVPTGGSFGSYLFSLMKR